MTSGRIGISWRPSDPPMAATLPPTDALGTCACGTDPMVTLGGSGTSVEVPPGAGDTSPGTGVMSPMS